MEKFLSLLALYKSIIRGVTRTLMRKNPHFLLSHIFLEYMCHRLQRLLKQNLYWIGLSNTVFNHMLALIDVEENEYIDSESCALIDQQFFIDLQSSWCYVCSTTSTKKYKLMIIPASCEDKKKVIISETTYYNLRNVFNCEKLDESCFLLRSTDNAVRFASEARISLIANPYDCAVETVDYMLEEYFSHPRYLHVNDVININMDEYAKDRIYSSGSPAKPKLYFTVNSLKLDNHDTRYSVDSCYVVRGISTLIQEAQVHNYIPHKIVNTGDRFPSVLAEPFYHLISCIVPFIQKDIQLGVRPIFLLKGPRGCGKQNIIRLVSNSIGLHMLCVNLAEVHTLMSAQTEAKLRIALQNAQRCVPCILYLSNMQVFGKTPEGQKDERVIFAFSTQIAALYEKAQREFPLIIVAGSDESDIPAELQRMFIETIHMKLLDETKQLELMSSLLLEWNLTTTADLSKSVKLCSNLTSSDLLALLSYAIKVHFRSQRNNRDCPVIQQEDFDKAYEHMRMMHSDNESAPRVPEVQWEDIGGLAELKYEIIRRILLPLSGLGQSGLLLYGPPGTGKTLLAKAVATEYHLHFLSIKGPEVLNMYVGQSEKNVREIFERARSASPCIIFFDELDSLAPNRGRSGDSGGVMDRVVSQLLAEMDGLEKSSGIFILGATNRPDLIDPALLRPGRFDKMLYVGVYSNRASKLSVLSAQTRKFTLKKGGRELEEIVDHLPDNVTGADLYSVSSNAWLNAVREAIAMARKKDKKNQKNKKEIDEDPSTEETNVTVKLQHFLDAIRDLVPSVSDEEIKRYNEMQTQLSSL